MIRIPIYSKKGNKKKPTRRRLALEEVMDCYEKVI